MRTSFGKLFFSLSPLIFIPLSLPSVNFTRLLDIVHADQKLYLVFEFLDVDLKRYIETGNQNRTPISLQIVKVRRFTSNHYIPSSFPFPLWRTLTMSMTYTCVHNAF